MILPIKNFKWPENYRKIHLEAKSLGQHCFYFSDHTGQKWYSNAKPWKIVKESSQTLQK